MIADARQCKPEIGLLWLAAMLLAAGVMVYALDRGGAAYFLPTWLARETGPPLFGLLGDHLPTFVHSLAFILITAAVLWPWPRLLPAICITWFAIECAFELGQLELLGRHVADSVPAWLHGVPVLEAIPDYFALGTFDPLDILSIALGAVIAYLGIRHMRFGATHDTFKR